jgi:hypothetical protein
MTWNVSGTRIGPLSIEARHLLVASKYLKQNYLTTENTEVTEEIDDLDQ